VLAGRKGNVPGDKDVAEAVARQACPTLDVVIVKGEVQFARKAVDWDLEAVLRGHHDVHAVALSYHELVVDVLLFANEPLSLFLHGLQTDVRVPKRRPRVVQVLRRASSSAATVHTLQDSPGQLLMLILYVSPIRQEAATCISSRSRSPALSEIAQYVLQLFRRALR
jgi:hypothetical protein